ncbi:BA71V-D339L (G9L) [Elysia marginata]|uniref:BA71V-D339L (G9L) n=1 Tax=Elysia marginata TaxID=1093978 RepID=A0AAV4GUJ3_9GAST|nr:BA71V-D339L (G9L) [Elysia marginata]
MITEKFYAETVDIADPENYAASPERYLMTWLRRRFEGRCRKGAYILRIVEISRRSLCRIKETDLSGEGYVDVEFLATVSLLAQWDILTGVVVANRAQLIVGKSEVEGVTIATVLESPEAETVREGQIISIRVAKAQYTADQAQATAVGPLLTCDKSAPVYRVDGELTLENARTLAPLVARVKTLLTARAALAKTRRESFAFFEGLLYSYPAPSEAKEAQTITTMAAEAWEGPPGHPLPAGIVAANLLEVVDTAAAGGVNVAGLWSRDLSIYRSSPLAAKVSGEVPGWWSSPVDATPITAFASMLKSVYEFLKAVNEMVGIYAPPGVLESHKNIWVVMRNAQLPAP